MVIMKKKEIETRARLAVFESYRENIVIARNDLEMVKLQNRRHLDRQMIFFTLVYSAPLLPRVRYF